MLVRRTLALQAVRALGVTSARWVADYFRTSQRDTAPLLPALAAEGALIEVAVEGWQSPGYIHPDNLALAEAAAAGTLIPELTTLLSPFDPLVWDRARALAMFGFDYRIECYTPAPKRRYGYFTLPILRRGQLIGRLDPKAHRKEGRLEIKALHLEPGVRCHQRAGRRHRRHAARVRRLACDANRGGALVRPAEAGGAGAARG